MLTGCLRSVSLTGALVVIAACSQPANSILPSAPSAVVPGAAASGFSGWSALETPPGPERGLNPRRRGGGKAVSGVGTVANLQGSCDPAGDDDHVSFIVQGVRVVTDEDTEFFISAHEDPIAGGCGNLRNGTKVRVVAAETPNDDFSYTAEKVTIVDQPGGPPPVSVAGEGVVAALKGECPALTMVVHGYPVMTTSSTSFAGGTCEDITPGTRIKVEGVLGGNSVVADSVEIVSAAEP